MSEKISHSPENDISVAIIALPFISIALQMDNLSPLRDNDHQNQQNAEENAQPQAAPQLDPQLQAAPVQQAPVYPAPADSHAHFLAFLQLIGVQLDGTRDLQYYQELYALVQQLPFLHALPDANSPREHQDAAISAWVQQYLNYQGLDTSVFQLYYNPNQTSMVGFHQIQGQLGEYSIVGPCACYFTGVPCQDSTNGQNDEHEQASSSNGMSAVVNPSLPDSFPPTPSP